MAPGNVRREAHIGRDEAALLNPEISNDDAFSLVDLGAAPEALPSARRNGSSGVEEWRRVMGGVARKPGISCMRP